jgi:hypothetical protein
LYTLEILLNTVDIINTLLPCHWVGATRILFASEVAAVPANCPAAETHNTSSLASRHSASTPVSRIETQGLPCDRGSLLILTDMEQTHDIHPSQSNNEHSAYLSAIRQIEAIPVPDLASTLTTPAEDEINEANISFLRAQIDPQDAWQRENAEREILEDRVQRMSRNDRARRDRLQRVLARLNRMHDPAYGDRVPSHNSLYDWSPASEGEDSISEEADLQSIQRDLRRQQPSVHPEVLRVLAQTELDQDRERRSRAHSSRFSSTAPGTSRNEASLRSAAILQAVRRHPRFSARSAQYMERYIMDRSERHALEAEEARTRAEENRATSEQQRRIGEMPMPSQQSDPRPRIRRAILQDPATEPSDRSNWLPSTVKYLANLRHSKTEEDGLLQAVDFHIATKEQFIDTHDDFLLDVYSLPPTYETSLLVPGAVFEGQQRAHTPNDFLSALSHEPSPRWESDWRAESSNSSRREYLPRFTLDEVSRQWTSSSAVPPHAQRTRSSRLAGPTKADFWPVKVKIHAVDYEKMTLAATMEAYDVPSQAPVPDFHTNFSDDFWRTTALPTPRDPGAIPTPRAPAPTPKKEERKSITTYLEGEILDFKNFTFKTESFKSSLENDATYWRKLEPFKDYSDEELIGRLTSKGYLEHLSQSYILMRWKERCFVRDSPSKSQPSSSIDRVHVYGSSGIEARDAVDFYEAVEMPDGFTGLTISGFYYVCMRRSDGAVEGLYCDPQSSPYQRLTLERKGEAELGRFPAWEFK